MQHKVLPDGEPKPELTPCAQAQGDKKDQLRRLICKAKEDWMAPDHPNWSIRDMDSADFLDSYLQPGQVELECQSQKSSLSCAFVLSMFFNACRNGAHVSFVLLFQDASKPV